MILRLQNIFKEDQKDRRNPVVLNDSKLFIKRDKIRKDQVVELLRQRAAFSPKDFFMAAMVFHHGSSIKDSKMAISLAKISFESGYKRGLALYATCIDRLLTRQNKKQKFGTQYRKKNAASKWRLLPIDPKTIDRERLNYNLPTLSEMRKRIAKLNKSEKWI